MSSPLVRVLGSLVAISSLAWAHACGGKTSRSTPSGGASGGGAAGAGGVGGTTEPGPDAPAVTEAEAAKLLAAIACKGWKLCTPIGFTHDYASEQDCVARLGNPEAYFGPGITVTVEQVATCAQAVVLETCKDFESYFNSPPKECQLPEGTKAGGEPCASSWQCSSGGCEMNLPCGKCLASTSSAGQPCSSDWGCEWGSVCVAGTCKKPAGLGQPCQTDDPSCQYGLDCFDGACSQPPGAGEPCGGGYACGYDLHCNKLKAVCESVVTRQLGEPCGFLADGSRAGCVHGARCQEGNAASSEGTCVPWILIGQPCTHDFVADSGCETPASCLDGLCQVRTNALCD